jgi:hydroxymethylpyrimidine/phosphomethylpyrimidine kinase
MKIPRQTRAPIALTIAGSDCSGGAGLEADLKTFAAHGVYGMAAVTCVVAESPCRVVAIQPVPAKTVVEQIDCCLKGMPPVAIKTGMLFSSAIIHAVRKALPGYRRQIMELVVDPVMVATSGRRLLKPDAIAALKQFIAERADLVTPNLDEAEILAGCRIRNEAAMEQAAARISRQFDCAVLVKGGHLSDPNRAVDFFWEGRTGRWFRCRRIRNVTTHGTGCTYAAAITAGLAEGRSLPEAVRSAKAYITGAVRRMHRFGPWMALRHD